MKYDMTLTRMHTCRVIAPLAFLAAAAFSYAQPISERFPSGSIRSVADADMALSQAATERSEIEARYVADEQACLPKFFATACIEEAKERRRIALSVLRPVEIEANAFKRQARVADRDKALAERLEKDERERQERALRPLPAAPESATGSPDESPRKVPPTLFSNRVEKHEEKMKRLQAEEAANAQKRAENIAAYEKKQRDALERQQKVAQRKAEKEQKRKAKQTENGNAD